MHYYTKFSTGNIKTLPTEEPDDLERVRAALLAFHRYHYRPENLTVVVAGPQSLDELQEWVIPRFGPMQAKTFPAGDSMTEAEILVAKAAKDAPAYHFRAPVQDYRPAFRPELQNGGWPTVLTVKPVRSMRRIVLMWPLPSVFKIPDQSPVSMLSYLLGHEGPNSSFAILQNAGLLSSLSAGPRVNAPDFSLFQIDIGLTELGETKWKEVTDVIFQHCCLIADVAKNGDQNNELRRIWGERVALNRIFFDQTSPGSVYTLAPSLSNSIVAYGTENSIAAGNMLNEAEDTFDVEMFASFASMLIPSNCLIERCGEVPWTELEENYDKENSTRKKEMWYDIDYFVTSVGDSDKRRWKGIDIPFFDCRGQLALPRENRYIPRSLELCSDLPDEAKQGPHIEKEIDPPKLLVNNGMIGRLWHRLDDRYALPKSSLSFLIRSAAVDSVKVNESWIYDATASVHSTLLSGIFSSAMAQDTYDADLAGLSWSLSLSSAGIHMSCNGFSDRLPDLSLFILRSFLSKDFIKESYFLSAKDRVLRSLRTYFESRRADSHSIYYRDFILAANDEGIERAIEAAEAATLDSTLAHHGILLNNEESLVDCLFTGNVSESEAMFFFKSATEELSLKSKITSDPKRLDFWIPGSCERRLQKDIELHFASKNSQEENGSVVVTYQSSIPGFSGENLSCVESLRSSASLRLISHLLREPLFDELRTKQTLGYIVSSYYDMGYSSAPPTTGPFDPWSVPVDLLVISVLSRKADPPEVLRRIDEFLFNFRETLVKMPDSEIADHASALSTKILKPIQKLRDEASHHFSKIRYHGPQVVRKSLEMPWNNSKIVAATIRSLTRKDLIEAWDRMILPRNRKRVTACVYGTTFPLQSHNIPKSSSSQIVVVDSLSELIELRKRLPVYDNKIPTKSKQRMMLPFPPRKLGAAALVGVGFAAVGWMVMSRSKKSSR